MNVKVTPHFIYITYDNTNEGEYNVTTCTFEFTSEYTGLSKVALFSNGEITKQVQLYSNICVIPSEVLAKEGTVALGVYGFEESDGNMIKRYSPKPQSFFVMNGSYVDTYPTQPTPSQIEQLQQQITTNANGIADINQVIPTLALKSEIPTKVSELTNDLGFIDKDVNNLTCYTTTTNMETYVTGLVNTEKDAREYKDNDLQSQIDAIVSSSDVKDIVGTYADLMAYDTSKLGDNDIIKVLLDSTHNDATSYYRWNKHQETWTYIGSEGPFYTKSETDSLLNAKANTSDLSAVAFTGSYNDLLNKPSIPTKTSDLTNDSDFTTQTYVDSLIGPISNAIDLINGEVV